MLVTGLDSLSRSVFDGDSPVILENVDLLPAEKLTIRSLIVFDLNMIWGSMTIFFFIGLDFSFFWEAFLD